MSKTNLGLWIGGLFGLCDLARRAPDVLEKLHSKVIEEDKNDTHEDQQDWINDGCPTEESK